VNLLAQSPDAARFTARWHLEPAAVHAGQGGARSGYDELGVDLTHPCQVLRCRPSQPLVRSPAAGLVRPASSFEQQRARMSGRERGCRLNEGGPRPGQSQ